MTSADSYIVRNIFHRHRIRIIRFYIIFCFFHIHHPGIPSGKLFHVGCFRQEIHLFLRYDPQFIQLKQILEKVINTHGATATAEVLDDVKAIGYKFSTRAAMTVSISDMTVPPQKPEMIAKAQETVDRITKNYKRGLITEEERYKEVVETWKATDDMLTEALLTGLDKYNNIFMIRIFIPGHIALTSFS